jgi:hypothetical protein
MHELEDMGLATGVKPIGGGWRYLQTLKGEIHRIPHTGSETSAKALIEAVRIFRINEGIELGDPTADVVDFIRKASPQNDRWKGRPRLGVQRIKEKVPLIQVCREWLDKTTLENPTLTDYDTAVNRAGVCEHCPQNVAWKLSNCADCNEKVEYKGTILRQRVEFALDSCLRACRLHGFHLPSVVFIDRDALPPRNEQAPEKCWVPKKP